MSVIRLENVTLDFRLYRNKDMRLKEWLIKTLTLRGDEPPVTVRVIEDVSFDIADGTRLGVIGANGAGKTSLLRVIAGIYPPTRGTVRVQGRITPLLETGTAFAPDLTGRENAIISGAFLGRSRREMEVFLPRIIEFSGLGDYIDVPLKNYSTGMVARLAFTVATEMEPEIFLCDEVFSVGDQEFYARGVERMQSLMGKARALVFVSHSDALVRQMCNQALWLHHGKVRAFGEVESVIRQYTAWAEGHPGEQVGAPQVDAAASPSEAAPVETAATAGS